MSDTTKLRRLAQCLVDMQEISHKEFDAAYPELLHVYDVEAQLVVLAKMAEAALAEAA